MKGASTGRGRKGEEEEGGRLPILFENKCAVARARTHVVSGDMRIMHESVNTSAGKPR